MCDAVNVPGVMLRSTCNVCSTHCVPPLGIVTTGCDPMSYTKCFRVRPDDTWGGRLWCIFLNRLGGLLQAKKKKKTNKKKPNFLFSWELCVWHFTEQAIFDYLVSFSPPPSLHIIWLAPYVSDGAILLKACLSFQEVVVLRHLGVCNINSKDSHLLVIYIDAVGLCTR